VDVGHAFLLNRSLLASGYLSNKYAAILRKLAVLMAA
jgi:hypothetical protein